MKTINSHNVKALTFGYDRDSGMSRLCVTEKHNGIYTKKPKGKATFHKKGKRERLEARLNRQDYVNKVSLRIKDNRDIY